MNLKKNIVRRALPLFVAGLLSLSFLVDQAVAQASPMLKVDGQVHYGFPLEDPFDFDEPLGNMRFGLDANLFFMPADFLPLGDPIFLGGLLGVRGTYNDNFILDIPIAITPLHHLSDVFHLQPFLGINNTLIIGDDSDYDLAVLVGAKAIVSSVIVSIDYQLKFLIDTVHVLQLGLGYRFSLM